jgi:hypothetical protein
MPMASGFALEILIEIGIERRAMKKTGRKIIHTG